MPRGLFRYLIGRRYERTKKAQGTNNQYVQAQSEKDQIDTFHSTADRIATDHGVSSPTVKRAAKFAQEVDANPEYKGVNVSTTPKQGGGGSPSRVVFGYYGDSP